MMTPEEQAYVRKLEETMNTYFIFINTLLYCIV